MCSCRGICDRHDRRGPLRHERTERNPVLLASSPAATITRNDGGGALFDSIPVGEDLDDFGDRFRRVRGVADRFTDINTLYERWSRRSELRV